MTFRRHRGLQRRAAEEPHLCGLLWGEHGDPGADLSHQCLGVALLLALLVQIAVMGWLPSFFFFSLTAMNQLS